MIELRVGRRRTPATKLLLAAASGALAATTASALGDAARRSRTRTRVTSAATQTVDLLGKAARDAKNRASGAAATAKGSFSRARVPDDKLVARVRSRIGRFVSHPHAVSVDAKDGHVVLSGPILRSEVRRLVREVRKVRGVRSVEDRLEWHERGDDVPALQGAGKPVRAPELLQEHWTPSLRVGAGVAGATAIALGAARLHGLAAAGLGGAGALLLARAIVDEPLSRILGLGGTRRSVELQKSITIHAPIDEVFSCWADYERFPELMDHVECVTVTGDGRSHWKVRGPLGTTVEWDAETTSFRPNHHLAWKSVDGSLVKHAGIVRFEPVDGGRATRIDVRLAYNPVVGYVGHAIAALFGVDPKRALDEDLLRMKSLLEEGKATAHGREVRREPVVEAVLEPARISEPEEAVRP